MRIMTCGDLIGLREPRAFLTTTARRRVIDQARRQKLEQVYPAKLLALVYPRRVAAVSRRMSTVLQVTDDVARDAAEFGLECRN